MLPSPASPICLRNQTSYLWDKKRWWWWWWWWWWWCWWQCSFDLLGLQPTRILLEARLNELICFSKDSSNVRNRWVSDGRNLSDPSPHVTETSLCPLNRRTWKYTVHSIQLFVTTLWRDATSFTSSCAQKREFHWIAYFMWQFHHTSSSILGQNGNTSTSFQQPTSSNSVASQLKSNYWPARKRSKA